MPSRAVNSHGRWLALTCLLFVGCGRIGLDVIALDDGGGDGPPDGDIIARDDASMSIGAPLDPGKTDVCLGSVCASQLDRCPSSARDYGGICGCAAYDVDADRDGTPDCNDDCPGIPDRTAGGVCNCAGAMQDSDRDGVENCNDLCADDALKTLPGVCGCGVSDFDADGDGMPDCADGCPGDRGKAAPGTCGCGTPETDTDGDGMPDCVDLCSGLNDASYIPTLSCGVGYCASTSTASSCVAGREIACMPGAARSPTDSTCDGVDDNCNGATDEDYVVIAQCGVGYCRAGSTASRCVAGSETACAPRAALPSDATCDGVDDDCNGTADEDYVVNNTCGIGYCRTTNTPSSCVSGVEMMCVAGTRLAPNDTTPDGVDDDCDGMIDEDACVTHTDVFAYRSAVYTPAVPGGCTRATIRLWGGAGASGSNDGGAWGPGITGGQGGAGGYADSLLTVSSGTALQLFVGQGGRGCAAASTGNATYRGGQAGTGNGGDGNAGANGSVTGGSGGAPPSGGRGGAGSFGGGGGGAGARLYTSSGPGGDGGGGTVLLVGGTRTITAGGGAGGGGAGSTFVASGASGGNGGNGCNGNGARDTNEGGGGGGGGICQGTTTRAGTGRNPYDPTSALPGGTAVGGTEGAECGAGGDGYATITWSP